MIKYVLTAIAAMMMTTVANAADVTVKTYTDGKTYISYEGVTEEGDATKLENAIWQANRNGNFTGDLWLNGPGGMAWEGVLLSEVIVKNGLKTIVNGYCVSACSLMWMAGGIDGRYIIGDGAVYFHFAYHDDVAAWNDLKEKNGWIGVQDEISRSTHFYTAHLLRWGVLDAARFVMALAENAGANDFYVIWSDNINETVGGTVL